MKKSFISMTNILFLVTMLFSACAAPTSEVVEKKVTEVIEVDKVVEVERVAAPLRVSVAQFPDALPRSEEFLKQAMTSAASELGEELGTSVEVEFEVRTLANDPCGPGTNAALPEYDLYLLDSPSALYAFQDHALMAVPTEIVSAVNPFEPGILAFTHPVTQVVGLPQAIIPLVTIYRPDILGKRLPEELSWEEAIELVEEHGLRVPEHPCIAAAAIHSALGPDLTEDLIFLGDYMNLVPEYASEVDELLSQLRAPAADSSEIVRDFKEGTAPLVIHRGDFLIKLAEDGYNGPVATTRFPQLEYQGGASHCVGWIVPAASSRPELAWALAEKLTRDPAMLQWGLANGMAPANQAGFDALMEDPSLAVGLLPEGLFDDL